MLNLEGVCSFREEVLTVSGVSFPSGYNLFLPLVLSCLFIFVRVVFFYLAGACLDCRASAQSFQPIKTIYQQRVLYTRWIEVSPCF